MSKSLKDLETDIKNSQKQKSNTEAEEEDRFVDVMSDFVKEV